MPHKRPKRSARELEQTKRGADHAPSGGVPLAQEGIPKSMARVLQAESVRKAYKDKRLRSDEGSGAGVGERDAKRRKKDQEVQQKLEIKHGESLAHFSRRVEEDMRVPMAEAMLASRNSGKRAKKAEAKKANPDTTTTVTTKSAPSKTAISKPEATPSKPSIARKTEFDRKPAPNRLNDIVQAPPSFTKLPRGASKSKVQAGAATGKTDGVVSMAQKQKMEAERERAIQRYRELKETRATGWKDEA